MILVGGGSFAYTKWKAIEEARVQAELAQKRAEEERSQLQFKIESERKLAEARRIEEQRRLEQIQRAREQSQSPLRDFTQRPQTQVGIRDPQRPSWQEYGWGPPSTPPSTPPRAREWEAYKQRETDRLRQQQREDEQKRLAEINRRRQQDMEDRRKLAEIERERRLKEAQDRSQQQQQQQQRDRLIQDGLRTLERLVR
jgi:hypothetical protein